MIANILCINTSLTVLIIAWKFKAKTQCVFTYEEFVNGMSNLGFVSIDNSYIVSFFILYLCTDTLTF